MVLSASKLLYNRFAAAPTGGTVVCRAIAPGAQRTDESPSGV